MGSGNTLDDAYDFVNPLVNGGCFVSPVGFVKIRTEDTIMKVRSYDIVSCLFVIIVVITVKRDLSVHCVRICVDVGVTCEFCD